MSLTNEANVVVKCSGVNNRAYQLQRQAALDVASPWASVGPPINASNTVVTFVDVGGRSNAATYYRVLAQ